MPSMTSTAPPSASLLPLVELARLEERRLTVGLSEIADRVLPLAGGVAARDEAGAWINCAVGMGFAGPVERSAVDALIAWYTDAGIEPRVELAPHADAGLVRHLADAGFVIRHFENVFVRWLEPQDAAVAAAPLPPGYAVEALDPLDQAGVTAAAEVVAKAFAGDVDEVSEHFIELNRRVARHPRTTTVVARAPDGRIVGAGALELLEGAGGVGHGACFSLAVHSDHRRRGLQQAMLAWRLRRAAERGATFVTISARPGVATEGNARRAGFGVAYTKVILVRPGPGLVPVQE
jgi:ribosomal protein S18 acetylase RimI-like enzyme